MKLEIDLSKDEIAAYLSVVRLNATIFKKIAEYCVPLSFDGLPREDSNQSFIELQDEILKDTAKIAEENDLKLTDMKFEFDEKQVQIYSNKELYLEQEAEVLRIKEQSMHFYNAHVESLINFAKIALGVKEVKKKLPKPMLDVIHKNIFVVEEIHKNVDVPSLIKEIESRHIPRDSGAGDTTNKQLN